MKYSELETPRLVLRGWRESDLEDLFAYCSNPEVGPDAGWQPHADKSVSRGVLRQFMDSGEVWAVVDRRSRRVIGSIGLHEEKRGTMPTAGCSATLWGKTTGEKG